MRPHTWDTLTAAAFFAAYCGLMGAMVVSAVPMLSPWRSAIVTYGLLPLGAVGIVGVIVINVLRRCEDGTP